MEEDWSNAQSRQSAKLFLQSSELGLPQPLNRRPVSPPPFGSGGRGTLAGERGGGRVPIPMRGHTLWYSVNICTLWSNVNERKNRDLLQYIPSMVGSLKNPCNGEFNALGGE
jgi:hypothetical protein